MPKRYKQVLENDICYPDVIFIFYFWKHSCIFQQDNARTFAQDILHVFFKKEKKRISVSKLKTTHVLSSQMLT